MNHNQDPQVHSALGGGSQSFGQEVRLGIEMGVPGDTGQGSFVRGGVEETPGFGEGTIFKGESSSYIIPQIPQWPWFLGMGTLVR